MYFIIPLVLSFVKGKKSVTCVTLYLLFIAVAILLCVLLVFVITHKKKDKRKLADLSRTLNQNRAKTANDLKREQLEKLNLQKKDKDS